MQFNRRQFVKHSSVGAAAMRFPTVCSSRVLGANEENRGPYVVPEVTL